MTDIKWIPVDPDNLPSDKDEVLAINSEGNTTVGYPDHRHYGKFGVVVIDDEGREMEDVYSFIPMKHLTRLWREQNHLVPDYYSKESEAYEILEKALLDPTKGYTNIFKEISSEASSTISFLAWEMLNQFGGDSDSYGELIYWIKNHITNAE
jgi:hypothetical protein